VIDIIYWYSVFNFDLSKLVHSPNNQLWSLKKVVVATGRKDERWGEQRGENGIK
jgi:hypothetical protein